MPHHRHCAHDCYKCEHSDVTLSNQRARVWRSESKREHKGGLLLCWLRWRNLCVIRRPLRNGNSVSDLPGMGCYSVLCVPQGSSIPDVMDASLSLSDPYDSLHAVFVIPDVRRYHGMGGIEMECLVNQCDVM